MPLTAGDKLGPYEILALMGKGGMGEVYRAHDARTGRDVAVKVSAERFNERFDREVRAVAALNHLNICHLYDVGPNYLVMELVEGPTLADLIREGAIPLEEALKIAAQIAAALEAAHEKEITHRDLKPANIKIKADGVVKVLDFGLAKIGGTSAASPEDSPTISMAATQAGVILGTAAYMSPEQARGKVVDKRADIWSFGVVLHEMVTGRRLFRGEDLTETLAAVVMQQPDLSGAPFAMQKLLRKCLQKDPAKRLRDIGDAFELIQEDSAAGSPQATSLATSLPHKKLPWAVAGMLLLGLAVVSVVHFREQPAKTEVTRFVVAAPDKTSFNGTPPAISPDGRTLAFAAIGAEGRSQIWLKPMNSLEAHVLAGTDGVGAPIFWSPDGRSLGFSGPILRTLKKIDVAGGPARTLCPVSGGAPLGAWSPAGIIVYHATDGLMQVPAGGGTCTHVTRLDSKRDELRHTAPSFLPDGRHFLYLRVAAKDQNSGVYIGSLDSKPEEQNSQPILRGVTPAKYVASVDPSHGYLLFLREGVLLGQPFNAGSLSLTGDAVPIAEQVGTGASVDNSMFTASANGTLVYRAGQSGGRELTWYDRTGKSLGPVGAPGSYGTLSLSPDGKRVAFDRYDSSPVNGDVWVHDLAQHTTNRFTFDPARDEQPLWSPDGSQIVWSSQRDGASNLYQKPSNLAGVETALLKSAEEKIPQDWSRDRRFLLYTVTHADANSDLWVLPLEGERNPIPLLTTRFIEGQGRFSPDGRYIAYVSNESGTYEVYVRPFSADGKVGAQQMISQGGGGQPQWRHDGKELFYITTDSKLVAVPVSTAPTFQRTGAPVALFTVPIFGKGFADGQRFAAMPDGRKFLINSVRPEAASEPITVILNWME